MKEQHKQMKGGNKNMKGKSLAMLALGGAFALGGCKRVDPNHFVRDGNYAGYLATAIDNHTGRRIQLYRERDPILGWPMHYAVAHDSNRDGEFDYIEHQGLAKGDDMRNLTLAEMQAGWNYVKENGKNRSR